MSPATDLLRNREPRLQQAEVEARPGFGFKSGGGARIFAVTAYTATALESPPSNEVSYPVPLATPTPTPTPTLSGMTVVNVNGTVVGPFINGYTYNESNNVSVRASPVSGVGSVISSLDGVPIQTENQVP
jgi:hypothetical protein